ncbi:hypothetical protein CDAR_506351 [Caerostris darwini]|uniref:Uncharacterized protein n=1 Tax=Caerostris darwini TaxID=1538125 RepID=A0AAV4V1X3_9ARAC|nr:hypothetical protein CDAR_506351 [Caerostris darwini]
MIKLSEAGPGAGLINHPTTKDESELSCKTRSEKELLPTLYLLRPPDRKGNTVKGIPLGRRSPPFQGSLSQFAHDDTLHFPSLLSAIRSALPTLQSTQNDNEKAIIVFEHYHAHYCSSR